MQPNAPFTPPPKLTVEEKTRLARRFRRQANLTDGSFLLAVLLLAGAHFLDGHFPASLCLGSGLLFMLLFLVSSIVTYHRCPICGNRIIHDSLGQSRYLGPVIWRMYECPVCNFSPDWSR